MNDRFEHNLSRLEQSLPELHLWLRQRQGQRVAPLELANTPSAPPFDREQLRSVTLVWFGVDRAFVELLPTLDGEVNAVLLEPRIEGLVALLSAVDASLIGDRRRLQIVTQRRQLEALGWDTFALGSILPVHLDSLGETALGVAALRHVKRYLERRAQLEQHNEQTYLVMLTFDRLPMTRLTLARLALNTITPFRLVIADNGSTDGTVEWLQKAQLPFVERVLPMRKNLGIGRALNNALIYARARSRHLGRLDNDILVPPFWLRDLKKALASPLQPRVVGGFVTDDENIRVFIERGRPDRVDDLKVYRVDCVGGACNLYHSETFRDLGYLPEEPLYGVEDGGLAKAVRRAGDEILIVDNVKVEHLSTLFAALGDDASTYDLLKSTEVARFVQSDAGDAGRRGSAKMLLFSDDDRDGE